MSYACRAFSVDLLFLKLTTISSQCPLIVTCVLVIQLAQHQ